MSSVLERRRTRTTALAVLMIAGLWGCEGAGIGVSYSGYYEPYDYDYDYDYGPWGPDYYVGPPVIVGGVHGRDRGRPPHFRPPPASRPMPSIPSRARPR